MTKTELALKFIDIGVLQFGNFTLKSGLQSPFYLDFRRIVGYPYILKAISQRLWAMAADLEFDHLCGVPYAALSLSSTMSILLDKPLVIKRKEAKGHGTKKMVEGVFKQGDTCLVIDDVISSGISMIETLEALEKEGLVVQHVLSIVDRMQSGVATLARHGYQAHSLYTVRELLNILLENDRITEQTYAETMKFIKQNQINFEQLRQATPNAPLFTHSYADIAAKNTQPVSARLLQLIESKQTNLCAAADLPTGAEVLQLADQIGDHICALKIHADTLPDFSPSFVSQLKNIAREKNFLIFEDRKIADIGSVAQQQFTDGLHQIADWADLVTVHAVAGSSSIDALQKTGATNKTGLIVIVEMSTADTLATTEYSHKAANIAAEYPASVVGIVSQNQRPMSSAQIMFTPGIHLEASSDQLGQTYQAPAAAFTSRGVDVIIVGRGIYQSPNPAATAAQYQAIAWAAYQSRIK
jgi:uridine monophosphate synthetase